MDWRARIESAIKADGRSLREISLAADVSHGYLHGILRDNKEPTLDRFLRICAAMHVSAVYVLTGLEMNQETEAIVRQLQADAKARKAIFAILDLAS
jgi:ribonucleoside-diphosphate reductase alpha chain